MAANKRSPQYPFISLKKALIRARELYEKEGRNRVPVPIAVGAWGYNSKSSGGNQTIAALKAYGLISDTGSKQERKVHLTDIALRVLLDERPGSAERKKCIRQLALYPKIFKELWNTWRNNEALPSESNMRHNLVFDYDFNENVVGNFIQTFKETIDFAGLKLSSEAEDTDGGKGGQRPDGTPPHKVVPPKAEIGMHQDTFSTQEGVALLQWPSQLSKESAEDIEAWLTLVLRKILRSAGQSKAISPKSDDGNDII